MTKHTLFVCKTCSGAIAHDDVTEDTVTEGGLLLEHLQGLNSSELEVRAVGCLWTCDRPCAVTFACPGKYTYHFVDLHHEDSVAELQQFSDQYLNSVDGYVKPMKMPGELRSRLLVRIPPLSDGQPA